MNHHMHMHLAPTSTSGLGQLQAKAGARANLFFLAGEPGHSELPYGFGESWIAWGCRRIKCRGTRDTRHETRDIKEHCNHPRTSSQQLMHQKNLFTLRWLRWLVCALDSGTTSLVAHCRLFRSGKWLGIRCKEVYIP